MAKLFLFAIFICSLRASASDQLGLSIDWSQPPVGCAEEMVPSLPDRACLDLSSLKNPFDGWPSDLNSEDKHYWETHRRHIIYCRSKEVMKREATQPGSQPAGRVEYAWMVVESISNFDEKVNAIYDANRIYGVPYQVLTGALYQESVLMQLGISRDGGNYSCGIGQVNLEEWCHWANRQTPEQKQQMGWPAGIDCDATQVIDPKYIAPFYEVAKTRLNGLPEYRLLKEHFQNIPYARVRDQFPEADESTQKLRYQVSRSFIDNCSEARNGIMAKANELAQLYSAFVPAGIKVRDRYENGARFNRSCRQEPANNAYPLHTGWLMAVASYNAGPNSLEALAYYNHWNKNDIQNPQTWNGFYADKMIESFYWAGKFNPRTQELDYRGYEGQNKSWRWWKACIVQRHIARVIQHVQLTDNFIVDTLEGENSCRQAEYENGHLVNAFVPEIRQRSSGVK